MGQAAQWWLPVRMRMGLMRPWPRRAGGGWVYLGGEDLPFLGKSLGSKAGHTPWPGGSK